MASEAAKKKIAGLLSGAPKGGDLPRGLLSKGSMSKYTPTMREKIAGLLAKNWYGDTREGYRQAEKLVNVGETVVPPLGLLSGSYDAGRALGGGNMMQAGVLGGLAMLPLPGAAKKGIRAYHGSPHSFDKFSMDKIGTGEGAQAYGHGLYFADREGTAKAYRDALSNPGHSVIVKSKYQDARIQIDGATSAHDFDTWSAAKLAAKHKGNLKSALSEIGDNKIYTKEKPILEKWLNDGADVSIEGARPGHMYEVNIDADPEQFLDWDKPLPISHPIREKLADAAMKATGSMHAPARNVAKDAFLAARNENMTGEGAHHQLSKLFETTDELWPSIGKTPNDVMNTKQAAALALRQQGIPGIKYLDAGSRAKGDGSRNYVVFDEKLISIVRKYGIAGASTILGYDLLSNVTTDQAETLKQAERVY